MSDMNVLRSALRAELFAVLNEGEHLTVATCSTVMRLAEAARDVLQARASKPEDFEKGTTHVGDNPEAPGLNVETYGVKMLKEMMPVLAGAFRPKPQQSTAELVRALAEARRLDLDDVAEELEAQLNIPKSQPIPVLRGSVRPVAVMREHVGKDVDKRGFCEVSDCGCRTIAADIKKAFMESDDGKAADEVEVLQSGADYDYKWLVRVTPSNGFEYKAVPFGDTFVFSKEAVS